MDLSPCEFLDYDGTDWIASYDFYNDIVSNAVADTEVAKQYDDIPLTAEENLLVKNKAILANVVKGYDAPDCIIAKPQIDFGDVPNPKLYKITGVIRIVNEGLQANRSPILYDSAVSEYPFFGGVFGSPIELHNERAATDGRQFLPDGGFTVYLANTPYFAISKQVKIDSLPQRGDTAIDVSEVSAKTSLKNFYTNNGDIYSTFEILAPAGEYIVRIASHWCSFGDLLGKGFMYDLSSGLSYQKTSTFTYSSTDIGGVNTTMQYELKAIVTNADTDVGTFYIIDGTQYNAMTAGYVFDNFGDTDVQSVAKGVTIECALVSNQQQSASPYPFVHHPPCNDMAHEYILTDHNGYF